jgi:hypothetical protein
LGAKDFEAFKSCLFCTACYTVLAGAANGCPAPPPSPDACDVGMANDLASVVACLGCAGMGTCSAQATACKANAECQAINKAVNACP